MLLLGYTLLVWLRSSLRACVSFAGCLFWSTLGMRSCGEVDARVGCGRSAGRPGRTLGAPRGFGGDASGDEESGTWGCCWSSWSSAM